TACIEATLGRNRFDRIGHRRYCDAQNAVCSLSNVESKRRSQFFLHSAFCRSNVKLHFAAQEVVCVQPSQKNIGVGYRRLGSASPVAGGARKGGCALRAQPTSIAPAAH